MNEAKIISVANQKGGVGKTTTTLNLGAALAECGRRVLLVDTDPQANLTLGVGVDIEQLPRSLAQALTDPDLPLREVIVSSGMLGVDLAPATIELSSAELELANTIGRDGALTAALDSAVRAAYDYILIDTPPTLGLLTINALVASEAVIVPVQAHFYAVKGMSHLLRLVRQVRARLNERLRLLGILPTFYDSRTNLARQVVESLRETYPAEVFETVVRTAVRVAEAPIAGRSVLAYAPASEAAAAYRALAREVIARVEARSRAAA